MTIPNADQHKGLAAAQGEFFLEVRDSPALRGPIPPAALEEKEKEAPGVSLGLVGAPCLQQAAEGSSRTKGALHMSKALTC